MSPDERGRSRTCSSGSPARRSSTARAVSAYRRYWSRVAAQMPNEAMTEAQKKKKMEADRQKKNEQKELDNLNRVFEWCVARLPLPAPYSLLTRER